MELTFRPGRNGRKHKDIQEGGGAGEKEREMPRISTMSVQEMFKNRYSRYHEHHKQKMPGSVNNLLTISRRLVRVTLECPGGSISGLWATNKHFR